MSITALRIPKADTRTKHFQLLDVDGNPADITGMTFKLGVKESLTATGYKITPFAGVIEDEAAGKFQFTFTKTMTNITPFTGVYAIAMYDGSLNRETLTPAEGVAFEIVEDIIDEP